MSFFVFAALALHTGEHFSSADQQHDFTDVSLQRSRRGSSSGGTRGGSTQCESGCEVMGECADPSQCWLSVIALLLVVALVICCCCVSSYREYRKSGPDVFSNPQSRAMARSMGPAVDALLGKPPPDASITKFKPSQFQHGPVSFDAPTSHSVNESSRLVDAAAAPMVIVQASAMTSGDATVDAVGQDIDDRSMMYSMRRGASRLGLVAPPPMKMTVIVPPGMSPGMSMQVQTPTGVMMITIPVGAGPGQPLEFTA